MNDEETPINARPHRPPRFERTTWAFQRWLVWPFQDRFNLPFHPAQRLATAGAIVAVTAVAGAGAFALASSGGSPGSTSALAVAGKVEPRVLKAKPEQEPGETLQGATPVFVPTKDEDTSKVGGAKPLETEASDPTDSSASAATDTISSTPSGGGAGGAASASSAAVDGPPAGPEALAVARKFADAFVLYETGGEESEVRIAFAATTTPELSRSLLRRPPRLPASGEVPEARVVNVVAGPSHGGVYTVSISLLRVGLTSELRLDMEKLEKSGWRVTNVLG